MVKILNIPIYSQEMSRLISDIVRQCQGKKKQNLVVTATGAHGLVTAKRDKEFAKLLGSSYANLPDGVPLVWMGRIKGAKQMQRCYGPDFFKFMMLRSAGKNIRHFLCGGKLGVADDLKKVCTQKFHNQHVVGTFSPPFSEMRDCEIKKLAREINKKRVDIVWIGISTPKQEKLAYRLSCYAKVNFIVTVGAAFDFHTGRVREAPRFMQNIGLEWFLRLAIEPKRLWKRYIDVVPKFIIYCISDLWSCSSKNPIDKGVDCYPNRIATGGSLPFHASMTASKISDFAIKQVGDIALSMKKKYLDVGCGNGYLTSHIAPYFKESVGIDIDKRSIDTPHTLRGTTVKLVNMSGDKISYPDNYFDFVTAFEVLEHVKDIDKIVKEMLRVTKDCGTVVVTVPNVLFPLETHGVKIGAKVIKKKVPLLPYMPPLHRRLALARNFSVRQIDGYFIKNGAYPVRKPAYIAPQFERQAMGRGSWEGKFIFLRILLNKVTKIPAIGSLAGVSLGRVYRKGER
jgi:N-acetylglucosaminyldiphosphoundecaprenol N-acetyl-beta-D-mannosaminyltransferase